MRRKFILGAMALILPLGSAIGLTAGSASASGNVVTGTGNINCSKLTGTITFKPPIKLSTPQTVTTTVKTTATGCKSVAGHTAKPLPTSVLSSSVTTTKNDVCTNLTKSSPFKSTETYLPAGIAPSTFTGTSGPGPSGSTLSFAVKGAVAGSYKSTAASAKAVLQETQSQAIMKCSGTGLAVLHIISGSTSNG